MSRHIIVVSAHPDDMEIGMGGTVAKLVESQAPITSVVITDGGRSSNPFGFTEQRMAEVRREEALRAAHVLGVREVAFCDQPDAAEEIDVQAVKRKLVELLAHLQPDEIYTLDEEGDRHPAHRLPANWRGKAYGSQASSRPPASGHMKSGDHWRLGTGLNTSMCSWLRRWRLSRSITVKWPRFPTGKGSWG